MKKLDVNDYSFVQLIITLLLHYLVKCRCHVLAVYNDIILGSRCIGSEKSLEDTKSLKTCYLFNTKSYPHQDHVARRACSVQLPTVWNSLHSPIFVNI